MAEPWVGNLIVVQWVTNAVGGLWNTPAYFNGMLFYGGVNDRLKAFSITNGVINLLVIRCLRPGGDIYYLRQAPDPPTMQPLSGLLK